MIQEGNNIKILLFLIILYIPDLIEKSAFSYFALTLALSFIISFLSYKLRFLSLKGAFAIFLLASIIFGLGGLKWTIPILVFFIFSSLLSRMKRRNFETSGRLLEKYSPRNHKQVFANGGFGGLLVILNFFFPSQLFYISFVSSIAAVCADTWATEVGTTFKAKTVDILSFKIVEQGISGGISFTGTFAGLTGAAVIAVSSIFWLNMKHFYYIIFIIFAGIIGNFSDSILGSSVQAKYKCTECFQTVENSFHCGKPAVLTKGFKYINNDVVNFATAVIGGLFGFLFIEIF
jgi:uncharacterized protein (TIGR00297 family)